MQQLGRSGLALGLLCALAGGLAACATPVEVLRENADTQSQLFAIEELQDSDDPARLAALAEALADDDLTVRESAALSLGEMGDEGRDALLDALGEELTACAAAPILAAVAEDHPEVVSALDPTIGKRGPKSCITKAFRTLGAAGHTVIIEALGSGDASRQRRAVYLACRIDPPVPSALAERLMAATEDDEDALVTALALLLERRPKKCPDEADEIWERLWAKKGTRHLAVAAVDDHDRRDDLLRPKLGIREDCSGVDALILLVESGLEPDDALLEALRKGLEANQGGRCPTVNTGTLVSYVLGGGLRVGNRDDARRQLAFLMRLGWKPETAKALIYVAIIQGRYDEAAERMKPAGPPLLDALVNWKLQGAERVSALAALSRVGRSSAKLIQQRYDSIEDVGLRDGLLGVYRDVLGARSADVAILALTELERSTDDEGRPIPDGTRAHRLKTMVRAAGEVAAVPLAEAIEDDGKPQLRLDLLRLLVETDGPRGETTLETVESLLTSDEDPPAVQEAAEHLIRVDRAGVKARVKADLAAGKLTDADVHLLRVLLRSSSKKLRKLVTKSVKKVKQPEALATLANQLLRLGMPYRGYLCAAKAGGAFLKASMKAAKAGDGAAADKANRRAGEMVKLRQRLFGEVFELALDRTRPDKERISTLKAIVKLTKGMRMKGSERLATLRAAYAEEDGKKLRKAMKKTIKKLKKRK